VVGLTSQQRHQLDELAGEIAHENPRLARALAGRWYARRLRRNTRRRSRVRQRHILACLAMLLMLAAVPLLCAGAIVAQPVLILLGAIAIVSGPALVAGARLRRPPAA
jgi:hypothetical protein